MVEVAADDATQCFTIEELRQLQQVVLHARNSGRGTNMDGLVTDIARAGRLYRVVAALFSGGRRVAI